jgi:transcriptional regulator with XRE-family HTH domain
VLVEAREEAGITQRELAARLRIPYTTVSRVELGERRLDVLEFMLWADALGIPAATLFKRVERRVGIV